jgi:hypothetical protein
MGNLPKFPTGPALRRGHVQPQLGSNRALGGIDLPFMFFLTLAGATVDVDGQVVVLDNGA